MGLTINRKSKRNATGVGSRDTSRKIAEAYTSADREILGNKAGMKQAFKRMSRKDFHERFGHQGSCKNCRICQMVKGLKRKIFTKVDPYRETRVGHTWAMDGITFDARSEQGCLYLVVLRDVASGAFQLLPLFRKTDAIPAFKDWVESMWRNPLYQNMPYPVVSVVQTDNEGTWMKDAGDWNEMIDSFEQTVEMRYVCPDAHEKENGYAEAACKVVEHSRQHWVRTLRDKSICHPVHVDTKGNLADFFTKPLDKSTFWYLMAKIHRGRQMWLVMWMTVARSSGRAPLQISTE